jgi:hypothetical protein
VATPDRVAVRVLVAEDYPDTRRTRSLLLRSWGFDVRDHVKFDGNLPGIDEVCAIFGPNEQEPAQEGDGP